jgi:UDP-glucose 4-epimerase
VPLFPKVKNERSVLYIDNLSEFIRLMIDNGESGVFFPQNREYMNTSEAVRLLGAVKGKRIRLLRGFTLPLRVMGVFVGFVHKAFGSFTYDVEMSEYKDDYRKVGFEESIAIAYGKQDNA